MKKTILISILLCLMAIPSFADSTMPLNFTAVNGSASVALRTEGSPSSVALQYSTDNCATWNTYTMGSTINLASGAKVYFKALNTNSTFNLGSSSYNQFSMTGTVAADGNVMSLLDATMSQTTVPAYAFYKLFRYCSSLIQAPELPATTLSNNCYMYMFGSCQSLVEAPALPATNLAEECYYDMFYGCKALTDAPYLPATNLPNNCYAYMFDECSSLTHIHTLPVVYVGYNSCDRMYSCCSSLVVNTQGPGMPWSIPSNVQGAGIGALYGMFTNTAGSMNNTPAVGTVYYLPVASCWVNGNSNDTAMGRVNGGGSHHYGDTVTLTATATVGNHFVSWSNNSTSNTLTFALTQDTTITAIFEANDTSYLHFTAVNGPASVALTTTGKAPTVNLQYSVDKCSTWNTYTIGSTINLSTGAKVFFKALNTNGAFYGDEVSYNQFTMTGTVSAYGNIMSLLDATMNQTSLSNYAFAHLFDNCTSLVNAPELPATTLKTGCYASMFKGCTSMVQAPALPAETIVEFCYFSMFDSCTSLTQAPALPATTMKEYCYYRMFQNCRSLTQAPSLPATTLEFNCYDGMFNGCTSLTQAPALPATDLVDACYNMLFNGCTSLTQAPALPATTLQDYCYVNMFSGCTSLTEAPALPATTLTDGCYGYMFKGCTSLTQTPELPATILTEMCYYGMFDSCTSLTQIQPLSITSLAKSCCDGMYSGCTSLVVNTQAPGIQWSIPSNVQNYSATSLQNMFANTGGTMNGTPVVGTVYYIASGSRLVTVNSSDSTKGSVTGGGTYNLGDTVTLTATPAPNHHFVSWSNNATTPILSFVLTQDTAFTATFAIDQHSVGVYSNDPKMGGVTGDGTYNYGDTVTLTATPAPNHHFVSWSNNATTPILSFVLTQDTAFTATFAIDQHSVGGYSNDPKMGGVTGDGTYNYGDTVTLTATPAPNHHFVAWSNNATTPTISFVLTQDTAFTATFAIDQHSVGVYSNDPKMGSVTGDGTYNYGDTVTLTATPAPNHHFVSWSNNATTPILSFVLTQDTAFTATFAIDQHSVGVYSNDPKMGGVTGDGTYNYGDTITLTATPAPNHHFVSWSNNATTPILSFVLTQDTAFTATFAIDQHSVGVYSNDPKMGSVTGDGTYNYGDTITLTATPAPNHHFVSWSNNATTPTISFVLTQDTAFTATFAIDQHTVTVNSDNPVIGSVNGGGTYNYGDTVTISALPAPNHHFVSWSNNATTPLLSFVLTQDTSFTATFAIDQHTVTVNSNNPAMGSVTSGGTYNYGDTITLTATPTANHHFVAWSNNATTPTISFALTGDTSFTAIFAIDQHTVTVNSDNPAMGSVTGGDTYDYGEIVTLTATPAANYHFVSWSNNATTPTISFTLTGDTSFTATFAINQHTVRVNSNNPGIGSVTGSGTYNYGDTVTITATPAANHHFVSWSNNATTPTLSFVLTQDTSFTATFAIDQHTVTVNVNNPAMGGVTGDGAYDYGEIVTLTATPAANHHFVSWSNGITSPTIAFVIEEDTSFTATFALNQHTVTANANNPAMGGVTGDGTYDYGDIVTLTATPAANYHFVSWSNNATTPTISFVITGDTSFTATFVPNQHTVTVNSNNPAMGGVTGGGTYNYGDIVTLTATPAANYHFVSWSNGIMTSTMSFTLMGDTSFTATFALNQHTVTANTNDPAMGSVTSGGTYNYGDRVTLTATPAANHHFVSWSNSATTPTISFVLTQDTILTATFEVDACNGFVSDNLYWSIDQRTGELSFSGTGSTPDYSPINHAPWYYKRSLVTHITMPAGVVSCLGDYAFDDFTNLYYAEVNADTLGASIFNGCSTLALCYSETNAVANANTMDGCNANPVLIVHDYQWYKHTYTDSLALALNIYPYRTDYTEDLLLTMNATVTLLPSYKGISVIATRHLVNGDPLHLTDNCNIIWKDRLVAPLVYEFLSQGVGYIGKNSFLGCTTLHRITVTPKYWGTNGTTSDYAYAHLDSIHADAFDSIHPDIVDLYEETQYQPGKVMSYTAQKNNLDQTLLYVPDTLAATGKTMLAQYKATPYWNDNFADINNKNLVDTQYVDTASAHVAFYYQDVIDSVPVASYHAVIYKVGGTDTADIYFSNDTTFTINRLPRRIIQIVDSVTGTTTTITINIEHSAYNPNIQEVNVQIEHLSEGSNYSITISPLDAMGNVLATDSCTLYTGDILLSDPTITEDDSDEILYPTEDTDVYLINGCYIGKYSTSLPPGVYLMREGKKWYKFAKTR